MWVMCPILCLVSVAVQVIYPMAMHLYYYDLLQEWVNSLRSPRPRAVDLQRGPQSNKCPLLQQHQHLRMITCRARVKCFNVK